MKGILVYVKAYGPLHCKALKEFTNEGMIRLTLEKQGRIFRMEKIPGFRMDTGCEV